MTEQGLVELLKTIKGSHRVLILASALCFVLLVTSLQGTAYDDALDELRTLSNLRNSTVICEFLQKYPEALSSQPALSKCCDTGGQLTEYLSRLCGVTVVGDTGESCIEQAGSFFSLHYPDTDSLPALCDWFVSSGSGTWRRCDESRFSWNPILPSDIGDTILLVGIGQASLKSNPDYTFEGQEEYEQIFTQTFSFVPNNKRDWMQKDVRRLELSMPATGTFSWFAPEDWIEIKGIRNNLMHFFGDSTVVLGGIRTLGLEGQGLTISGAISRIQQQRKIDRSLHLPWISISQSEPLVTFLAPAALLLLQLNLLLHCRKLWRESKNIDMQVVSEFPWISLYPGSCGLLYAVATTCAFPFMGIAGLAWRGFGALPGSPFAITAAIVLGLLSLTMGGEMSYKLYAMQDRVSRTYQSD